MQAFSTLADLLLTTASVDYSAEWGLRGTPLSPPTLRPPVEHHLPRGRGQGLLATDPTPTLPQAAARMFAKTDHSVPLGQLQPRPLFPEPPPPLPQLYPGRGPRPPRGSQATVPSLSWRQVPPSHPALTAQAAPQVLRPPAGSFPRVCAAQSKYGNSPQRLRGPLLPSPPERRPASSTALHIRSRRGSEELTHPPEPRTQPCQLLGPERDPGEIW